jgi:hypothetical protein
MNAGEYVLPIGLSAECEWLLWGEGGMNEKLETEFRVEDDGTEFG